MILLQFNSIKMSRSAAPVKGRELHTIGQTHRGELYETYMTVHFSIKQGDLRVLCDVDSRHSSVSIYIGTGDESAPISEREYLEIEFSKTGDSRIVGFQGNNNRVSTDGELALERPLEIDQKRKKRWQVCGFIPFFFLPSPGQIESDEFLLMWKINVTSRDLVKNMVLSLATLNGDDGSEFDPHQIECFQDLIISDEDAIRLRSVSRSSISRTFSRSTPGRDNKNTNISRFLSDIKDSDAVKQAEKEAETASGSGAFDYCETTADLVKALKELFPLTASETEFAGMGVGAAAKSENAELIKALHSLLRSDEEVLRAAKLWCRHGWSHKKVLLVLTADRVDCRLHLLSRDTKMFIRTLPWSITKPVTVVSMSEQRFDLEFIETSGSGEEGRPGEKKVIYHFLDQHGAEAAEAAEATDRLVSSIDAVSRVHDSYLRKRLGSGDHQILKYNLTRTRRESFFDEYCTIA